jgi:UDP-2-acetamido-3-amino-2,3-dideoxy-glucuronate N-acetyltransferase
MKNISNSSEIFIHASADVQSNSIGPGTTVWQYVVVLANAKIGQYVNINSHCFIENNVVIGDRVTIKSGVYLWDGIKLEDDVFIGPNVTFTNDKFPRSKIYPEYFLETIVEKGASIGAGAVILPGIRIGQGAMIGAGAVVTKSVPPFAIVSGSPGRITGYSINNLHSAHQQPLKTNENFFTTEAVSKVGVGNVSLHNLKRVVDIRGDLTFGEFSRDIPFVAKRYFVIFNVPSEKTRGEHAHIKCHQFLICVKGNCSIVVDDSTSRAEIVLNNPSLGLYIPPMTWGTQYKYSEDAVLIVFTSDYYEADDYIRNYGEFLKISEN